MDNDQKEEEPSQTVINPPADEVTDRPDSAKIMNQMRKWGCHFDPLFFLEWLDELRQGYEFTGEQMLIGLPEMLRDDSLL